MRFRKIAGLSAGALTLGMMGAVASTAPANAVVTTPATASFTCGSGAQASTYNATITLTLAHDNGAAKLSAKFNDMPNGAPPAFVNHPGATISNTLTVTAAGADVALTGSHTADFIGGTQTKMPEAKASFATRPSSISLKSYSYKVVNAAGGAVTTQNCTLESPVPVTFADEAQLAGVNAVCTVDMTESGFGGKGSYPAKLETTATAPATGKVGTALSIPVTTTLTLGREFSDYLQTSPVKKVTGAVTPSIAVGSAAGTGSVQLSTWNRTLSPGTGIGQPVNEFVSINGTGTVAVTPAAAGALGATLSGAQGTASLTVTFGDAVMDAPLDCALTAPQALGTVNVAAAGPSAACVKAQGAVKSTAAAVKKADAKVKSTKNAVKKATKAAKKAKGKKAKKAKAKLKKAKKAASSAAKAAKSAKSKHAAATNSVKASC